MEGKCCILALIEVVAMHDFARLDTVPAEAEVQGSFGRGRQHAYFCTCLRTFDHVQHMLSYHTIRCTWSLTMLSCAGNVKPHTLHAEELHIDATQLHVTAAPVHVDASFESVLNPSSRYVARGDMAYFPCLWLEVLAVLALPLFCVWQEQHVRYK